MARRRTKSIPFYTKDSILKLSEDSETVIPQKYINFIPQMLKIGTANKVRHSFGHRSVGTGEQKRDVTEHSVLFEIDSRLLSYKQDREQIPINEGDQLAAWCTKGNPARILYYKNHTNNFGYFPSQLAPCIGVLIGLAILIVPFFLPIPELITEKLAATGVSVRVFHIGAGLIITAIGIYAFRRNRRISKQLRR